MNQRVFGGVLLGALTVVLSLSAHGQVGKATPEELSRTGNGPGPVPGGAGVDRGAAIGDVPPSRDPRDFSGTWRVEGARPTPEEIAAQTASTPRGALSDRILCLPDSGTKVGRDGPLLIVQTPEQITWAAEEMHTIRRIFLKGGYTPGFKPNYLGESVGHWEGNTLVVETRGLKRLAAGAKLIERWTKSADGRSFQMQIAQVDRERKPIDAMPTQTLHWRGGEELLEWMCEDYNDEWLPGGADYSDQVKK